MNTVCYTMCQTPREAGGEFENEEQEGSDNFCRFLKLDSSPIMNTLNGHHDDLIGGILSA
jgi:hypothetical protein